MASFLQNSSSVSAGRAAIDDLLSPYFLHHSDNPAISLVSQPLTGDNYASWSRATIIAMTVKNKLGFLDGSIAKPADTDLNLSSWIRNNNVVIAWILNSVSKDISASILFADSAYEIWNDLREQFQQSNGPRIFQLRRELINLRQDQQSVAVYFTKLKSLWVELSNFRPSCTCGQCTFGGVKNLAAFSHHEYVLTFLLGLNESFTQIRGQLLLLNPLPPINKVFWLVSQEECQRTLSSQSDANTSLSNNLAFAVKGRSSGHDFGFPTRGAQRERPFCTKCQINGHTIDTCHKIHGYPLVISPNLSQSLSTWQLILQQSTPLSIMWSTMTVQQHLKMAFFPIIEPSTIQTTNEDVCYALIKFCSHWFLHNDR
ncbi:uncharacterized protein LOC142556677 [Primulina tabacum]|uniref:uncharacterized protein LOC142556677 n=1 Tax=Primulina tabacum TaxID=48773 RepID=UPI003F5AAA41